MDKLKIIIKIAFIFLMLIIIGILSLSYTITQNQNYQDSIAKKIQNHYQINTTITYTNIYGNYYIFTTPQNVIVLNKEFEEVLKEKLENLASNKNNYEIIYKTNQLMYEKTIAKKDNIIYEYYDIKTYKQLKTTKLEK